MRGDKWKIHNAEDVERIKKHNNNIVVGRNKWCQIKISNTKIAYIENKDSKYAKYNKNNKNNTQGIMIGD